MADFFHAIIFLYRVSFLTIFTLSEVLFHVVLRRSRRIIKKEEDEDVCEIIFKKAEHKEEEEIDEKEDTK